MVVTHQTRRSWELERNQTSWDEAAIPLLSVDEMVTNKTSDETTRLVSEFPDVLESSSSIDVREHKKPPWWAYIWNYDPTRTKQERRFVQKLDLSLLTILSLGYFIKNLDSTNIANAYVSGMKETLNMNANELNLVDVAWTTGYVLGQLPSQLILTRVRPSIWIPSCELLWTLLTFSLAMATTSKQVIIIRFLVGLAESIFYPAAHFLLGSWYKPSELGKRASIFHASSAVAGMFSGYLQAGVYRGMNGMLGKEGWQWLFIMDALISAPVCIVGFFLIPDLPENTRAFYLSGADAALARRRMDRVGRAPRSKSDWSFLRRVFSRWHIYALTILYTIFINIGPSSSISPFALWLKSKNYPVTLINIIPTGAGAIQLISTLTLAILSDSLQNRPLVMSLATSIGLLTSLLLFIWNIPHPLKWLAFLLSRAAVPFGPLAMSWANEICSADAEERALVLGSMNAAGYAVHTWLPLLTYPVGDQPRFRKGFAFSSAAYLVQFAVTGMVFWSYRREGKRKNGTRDQRGDEVETLL